jgi:hypothetical protein
MLAELGTLTDDQVRAVMLRDADTCPAWLTAAGCRRLFPDRYRSFPLVPREVAGEIGMDVPQIGLVVGPKQRREGTLRGRALQ